MFITLICVYFFAFILLARFLKEISIQDKILSFLIVFMTSGFVYLSSILILLFLIYDTFLVYKPKTNQLIQMFFFVAIISVTSFLGNNNKVNFLEYLQLIIFGLLLIFIRIRDYNYMKSVCTGFFIGSIIISASILISHFIFDSLSQETLVFFSISSTYNYTIYFLFFGLIISSEFLFTRSSHKILCFFIFSMLSFLLQSRSGFTLGLLFFVLFTINVKINFRSIFLLSTLSVAGFFTLNSSFIDKDNPNDILYSIVNFDNNTSNLERVQMVLGAFKTLNQEPYGAGVGNTSSSLKKLGISHPHAHNLLANWVYELGYIGIILTCFFFIFILKSIRIRQSFSQQKFKIAIIAYIIVMSVLNSLQFNIMVSLITFFGISLAYSNDNYSEC